MLLCCGAVTGGVLAAVFLTDVIGYQRVSEWFPPESEFDWGSFLGGALAGVSAFSVLFVQRYLDRKSAMQRKVSQIHGVCLLLSASIADFAGAYKTADLQRAKARASADEDFGGFLGFILRVMKVRDRVEAAKVNEKNVSVTDEEVRSVTKSLEGMIPYFDAVFSRMWVKFDSITINQDIPQDMLHPITQVEAAKENLQRIFEAIKSDNRPNYWFEIAKEDRLHQIKKVISLHEAFCDTKESVENLINLCMKHSSVPAAQIGFAESKFS